MLHQFGQLLWTYPGILAATAGVVALFAAGITSYRLARRRMAYETWWSVHLYTYLALFLSFSHQVDTGASFVGHPVARAWWTALWLGTLASWSPRAIGLPLWRSLRHRCRVVGVDAGGPGRRLGPAARAASLDRLPVAGGQFLQWRFLRRGLWWQAHPYSLSAAPAGDRLRITVKDLGDHSAGLAAARSPARASPIEGPYGAFTADTAARDRVLLVGAGVGITPILALLQELPRAGRRRRPAARLDAPGPRPARRGRRRGRSAAAAACSSSSARATQVRLDARRAAPARPRRCAAATSTSAVPTPSRTARRRLARPACPPTASTSSPSPSEGAPMRRAPSS